MSDSTDFKGWDVVGEMDLYGFDSIGVRVLMRYHRKPTHEEMRVIQEMITRIDRLMRAGTIKNDPDQIQVRKIERDSILGCFGDAIIYVEEIPNGYMKDDPWFSNRPWHRVTTPIGHIVIGWRKRVISIDWKDTILGKYADTLFPEHDGTKSEFSIHAASYANATDIIQTLLRTEPVLKSGTKVRIKVPLFVNSPPTVGDLVTIRSYDPYVNRYTIVWTDIHGYERDFAVDANAIEQV